MLKTRLYEAKRQEEHAKRASERKSKIGSGDRSERIRTYNFPENRVTDHRINLTLYKLDSILAGNLDPVIEALKEYERQELRDVRHDGVSRTDRITTRSETLTASVLDPDSHPASELRHDPTETWTVGRLLQWTTDYLEAPRRGQPAAGRRGAPGRGPGLPADRALHDLRRGARRRRAAAAFRELVRRRAEGTPVAYLVGPPRVLLALASASRPTCSFPGRKPSSS